MLVQVVLFFKSLYDFKFPEVSCFMSDLAVLGLVLYCHGDDCFLFVVVVFVVVCDSTNQAGEFGFTLEFSEDVSSS